MKTSRLRSLDGYRPAVPAQGRLSFAWAVDAAIIAPHLR